MNNIVSIFSCCQGTEAVYPVSFIATAIAMKKPLKKVLMVHRGYGLHKESTVRISFDRYENIELETSGITDNLYTIHINMESGDIYSNPDETKHFLKKIAGYFDIVICDAGNDLNKPFALGMLLESAWVLYLIDGHIESINRYTGLMPIIKKLKIRPSGFIVDLDSCYPEYSMIHLFNRLGDESEDMTYVVCLDTGENGLNDLADDLMFFVFEYANRRKFYNREQQ